MTPSAELRCRCGEVRGLVTNAAPRKVNRVVCYCEDCQAFAHHLGRADLLDPHGGSDIIQVAPASLGFTQGQHRIAGVRLSPKGLYRWHTSCCNTPLGNTVGPKLPFVGIVAQAFDHGAQRADAVFGKPTGAIMAKSAIGDVPGASKGIGLALMVRAIGKVLGWRLGGQAWPNPFFRRETTEPIYPLVTLSRPEREALRRFCGPHPAARAL